NSSLTALFGSMTLTAATGSITTGDTSSAAADVNLSLTANNNITTGETSGLNAQIGHLNLSAQTGSITTGNASSITAPSNNVTLSAYSNISTYGTITAGGANYPGIVIMETDAGSNGSINI